MSGYQVDALFGDAKNTSMMGANMLNEGQATDSFDWGAVLTNGIRGAAYGAMAASVNEAYASGQLRPLPSTLPAARQNSLVPLLLIGAVVYAVVS